MSDVLPLPTRPLLQQYMELARELQQACKSGTLDAIRNWASKTIGALKRQWEVISGLEGEAEDHAYAERLEEYWRKTRQPNENAAEYTLAEAELFLAQRHGFASWPAFASHVEALTQTDSKASRFELAADAIVKGDLAGLSNLLNTDAELVQARSTREHRSTLLHYVSANGVEDFRQRTPNNIVEIAQLLLDAGSVVNAYSDAYDGMSTTLGLTATSCHPENAGVQIPLMELLIDRGAVIDFPGTSNAVTTCLRNGRIQAAELLVRYGARLDLQGAAGLGRLDIVKGFFKENGSLITPSTADEMTSGFAWACEFGQAPVVEFLLHRGIDVHAKLPHHGQTGLHWAAYGGHVSTVTALLRQGAPVDAKDDSFGTTPLEWALYAWGNRSAISDRGDWYETVALLVRAGAKLDSLWFEAGDEARRSQVEKLRADSRMQALLGQRL